MFQIKTQNQVRREQALFDQDVQQHLTGVLVAAAHGDFSRRADVSGLPASLAASGRAVNQLLDQMVMLRKDLAHMNAEHDRGDIDVTVDASRYGGELAVMAQHVNQMVGSHIAVKKKAMAVVKAFGEGDFDAPLEALPGKKAFINDTIEQVRRHLKGLIAEMSRMSSEHERGDIDVQIDSQKFQGDFRLMAQGINDMVGSHIAVKKMAMGVIGEFGRGNFDATLDTLPGKKVFINNTIEQVRGNLKGLIAEMNHMSVEHDRGDIDVMIDTERFAGDFRTMALGVNAMVNGHIAVKKKAMACVKAFGEGDFDAPLEAFPGKKVFINETIEQVRRNLKALIVDADMLAEAALAGQLDTRAEAGRHAGDFRRIIEGFNATLDAIVTPLSEVQSVLGSMEAGDLTHVITGDYQGSFAELKNAVNSSVAKLARTLNDVTGAAQALTAAASQVSSTSQSLSQSASEQAASVEETTASLQEMAS
ncbi:hypothetical protein C7444_10971, partial [Sphaerotilus hippei]